MKVQLQTVEFWRDVRGPGERNKADTSQTFSTMKIPSGEKEAKPTGLEIIWDQEARAIILAKESPQDPVIIVGWENVKRAIPKDPAGFMEELFPTDNTEVKPKNPGLAAMQKKNAAK
jgi:hypothetical protein